MIAVAAMSPILAPAPAMAGAVGILRLVPDLPRRHVSAAAGVRVRADLGAALSAGRSGVLESKINLFELVVGELDMILGRVQEDFDFEAGIFDAYIDSDDDRQFDLRLAEIGDDLARARTQYLDVRESIAT
jgi:hypothetical protein